jgi:uncharacterized protein (TIGR00369 family)
MKFFTDGEALFSWLSVPDHLCGWDNQIHGGIVATILDEIMAWTTMYLLKKFAVTQTMTIDFHKPVYTGEEIHVEGRVLEVMGKRAAKVEGFIYKEEKTLCAKCVGTFRLFTLEAMVRLGGMEEEAIRKWGYLTE